MSSKRSNSAFQNGLWALGALLSVQGFGSAVTEARWGTSFGVAGLLRAAGLPQWTDIALGAVGLALLLCAAARYGVRRRAGV
ncbi:hypothetical protein [Streptomyces sp. NPDC053560]|uniref:hypothetical protein n=1 Tax=Streptomyces sp. NPDC053560 TaxID=3365711 RepID=UPI0037D35A93